MTFLTALGIITAFLGTGFGISKYLKDQEDQAKLEEAGKDPASLAEKELKLNETTSQQNFELAKEQFNYQKDLNKLTMQREDNAYQRQVADLKAAGLSPLMVAGGSPASVLNSAQAPQKDMSGINNAISNMIGAYNDVFSRKLQSRQFALQNKVQTAQAFTQLAELSMQRKKANLENAILGLDYTYYKDHPERNLGLQSVIINALERVISKNSSALNTGFPNIQLPNNDSGIGLFDLGSGSRSIVSNPSVTPAQIVKDQKKIIKSEKFDYQNAIDILGNFSNSDFQQDSLRYIYRHTNAWREYETLEDFRNALLKAKNKQKFLADFPYIERKDFKLGS